MPYTQSSARSRLHAAPGIQSARHALWAFGFAGLGASAAAGIRSSGRYTQRLVTSPNTRVRANTEQLAIVAHDPGYHARVLAGPGTDMPPLHRGPQRARITVPQPLPLQIDRFLGTTMGAMMALVDPSGPAGLRALRPI